MGLDRCKQGLCQISDKVGPDRIKSCSCLKRDRLASNGTLDACGLSYRICSGQYHSSSRRRTFLRETRSEWVDRLSALSTTAGYSQVNVPNGANEISPREHRRSQVGKLETRVGRLIPNRIFLGSFFPDGLKTSGPVVQHHPSTGGKSHKHQQRIPGDPPPKRTLAFMTRTFADVRGLISFDADFYDHVCTRPIRDG